MQTTSEGFSPSANIDQLLNPVPIINRRRGDGGWISRAAWLESFFEDLLAHPLGGASPLKDRKDYSDDERRRGVAIHWERGPLCQMGCCLS